MIVWETSSGNIKPSVYTTPHRLTHSSSTCKIKLLLAVNTFPPGQLLFGKEAATHRQRPLESGRIRDGPAPQNRKIGPIAISPCETSVAFKCTTQPPPQTNELTSGLITSGNHSACVLKPTWRLK